MKQVGSLWIAMVHMIIKGSSKYYRVCDTNKGKLWYIFGYDEVPDSAMTRTFLVVYRYNKKLLIKYEI